jgi:hypothetical protein
MAKRVLPVMADDQAKRIIKDLCKHHSISLELLNQMVEIQRENLGRGRQIGISQDFSAAIADFLDAQDAKGDR